MAVQALVVLQVALGIGLLTHGIPKILGLQGTMDWMASEGFGKFGGLFAALVESIGAFLLIVGVYPRIMAGLIALVMLGAMTHHWKNKDPFNEGWEAAYLYFAGALVIVLGGVGWPALSL